MGDSPATDVFAMDDAISDVIISSVEIFDTPELYSVELLSDKKDLPGSLNGPLTSPWISIVASEETLPSGPTVPADLSVQETSIEHITIILRMTTIEYFFINILSTLIHDLHYY
jgi:hypothetical protein